MMNDVDIDRLIKLFDNGITGNGQPYTSLDFLRDCGGYSYYDSLKACDAIITALMKLKHRKPIVECPCCGADVENGWPVCRNCGQALDWGDKNEGIVTLETRNSKLDTSPKRFEEMMLESKRKYYDEIYSPEQGHIDMDNIICNLLRELGYGKGIDIFDSVGKYYV